MFQMIRPPTMIHTCHICTCHRQTTESLGTPRARHLLARRVPVIQVLVHLEVVYHHTHNPQQSVEAIIIHHAQRSTERPSVVVGDNPSEKVTPSMSFPNRWSVGRSFSVPLDNALKLCEASLVRREVPKCIQKDRDYGKYAWLIILQGV
jgi:hypothetical protein